MKRLVCTLTAIFATILIISCNKSSDNNGITGKWVLTAYYMDPGDGSGKWQNAPAANPEWLDFKTNNQLESSNSAMFSSYNKYQVLNDSTLVFTAAQGSSIQVRYKLSPGLLTITPSCIEGCGFKYKRPGGIE